MAKKSFPYFLIFAACAALLLAAGMLPPRRTGDGSEYYAMYIALHDFHRPWITSAGYTAYTSLYDSGAIYGLLPTTQLAGSFPGLVLPTGADFNHFWFYSLVAALLAWLYGSLSIYVSPHNAFLATHGILVALPAAIAYWAYCKRGLAAAAVLLLCSPMVWYLNKVHTEVFTVCLLLSATILMMRARYEFAALALATASTQNPSLALIAALPLLLHLWANWRTRFSIWSVVVIGISVGLIALHPAYYFFRFGVLTPQLLVGANPGSNLNVWYIWLVDPDVGLLPNLGPFLLVLIAGGFVAVMRPASAGVEGSSKAAWWLYVAIYFVVCIYSHSSTTNLNAGGTPGPSRYGLWYLPLFFPAVLALMGWVRTGRVQAMLVGVLVAVSFYFTYLSYFPTRAERYEFPTALSRFIQENLPGFYSPPPEIFLERYSGLGESKPSEQVFAVIGPDCKKVLVFPDRLQGGLAGGVGCLFDEQLLLPNLRRLARGLREPHYIYLDEEVRRNSALSFAANKFFATGSGKEGVPILGRGWNAGENWGTWSEGDLAELWLPCGDVGGPTSTVELTVLGLSLPGRDRTMARFESGGRTLDTGEFNSTTRQISLNRRELECKDGRARLAIVIQNAAAPKDMMDSADGRKLGIAIVGFSFK